MALDPSDSLAARVGELMRADDRIAAIARGGGRDPSARAGAILEAIADRERIAATVLEAIALEDQVLQSSMAKSSYPTVSAPDPTAQLIRRDRSIEALAHLVENQSREYSRIARRLEEARRLPGPSPRGT